MKRKFEVTKENIEHLRQVSKGYHRTQNWIVNEALHNYFNEMVRFRIKARDQLMEEFNKPNKKP